MASPFLAGPENVLQQERRYSEDTAREIDRAVRESVDQAFEKSVELLRRKRNILEEGARRLLQKETLVEDELQELFGVSHAPELAPS